MSTTGTLIDFFTGEPPSPNGEPQIVFQGDNSTPRKMSGYVPLATHSDFGAVKLNGDVRGTALFIEVCGILGIAIDDSNGIPNADRKVLYYSLTSISDSGAPVGRFVIDDLVGGVDIRTGTAETVGQSSFGQAVTLDNGSAIAVTLDDDSATDHFLCDMQNVGAGTATLTPSLGQIDDGTGLAASASLAAGESCRLFRWSDGNWRILKSGATKAYVDAKVAPLRAALWLPGVASSRTVVLCVANFDFTIAIGLTGWKAKVTTNPSATAVYSFCKNGVQFGTLTVSTSGTKTFASAAGASFSAAADDVFSIVEPTDATLADVNITIQLTRS